MKSKAIVKKIKEKGILCLKTVRKQKGYFCCVPICDKTLLLLYVLNMSLANNCASINYRNVNCKHSNYFQGLCVNSCTIAVY